MKKSKDSKAEKAIKLDGIAVFCGWTAIIDTGNLKPHPDNPNEHPKEQLDVLEKVIRAAGWRCPITVSVRSGFIIRGHARYMVAKRAGWKQVPIEFQQYESEAEELTDLIADNRIPELAKQNLKKLGAVIDKLRVADIDMSLTALSAADIEKIMGDDRAERPEVEFTEEVLLAHNYIVLYFNNLLDWQVAQEKFELKRVKDLIPRKGQPVGIGRVVDGAKWLDRIK